MLCAVLIYLVRVGDNETTSIILTLVTRRYSIRLVHKYIFSSTVNTHSVQFSIVYSYIQTNKHKRKENK